MQVVEIDGDILEKPDDADDAIRMLTRCRALCLRRHRTLYRLLHKESSLLDLRLYAARKCGCQLRSFVSQAQRAAACRAHRRGPHHAAGAAR